MNIDFPKIENKENVFYKIGVSQIPRILSLQDRECESKTYGCFDRYYWHYKILDFPNSRFQEAISALTYVYLYKSPDNIFYESYILKKWIEAGIEFWCRSRHKDGCVDESYPNERHFCATALSCYAITESIILLNIKNKWDFSNTGDWLSINNNRDVSNQMAGSAVALLNIYSLTGNKKYLNSAQNKLDKLISSQAMKGYYPEYGGLDVGYCSITLNYLASYFLKTHNNNIKESALKCIKLLKSLVDNFGWFDSNKMSRKTQYLYPSGFCVFDRSFLEIIENGLRKNVILNPVWMDDRYCVPFTSDYLRTAYLFDQQA